MKKKPDVEVLELAAATLHVYGCSNNIIKQRIGVGSETAVARLLDQSRGRLWDERCSLIQSYIDAIAPRVIEAADELIAGESIDPQKLEDAAGAKRRRLKSVRVFPSGQLTKRDHRHTVDLDLFSRSAASYVLGLLRLGDTWGITWGAHIDALTDAIRARQLLPEQLPPVRRFVPLCGEAYGASPTKLSSSALAQKLTTMFGADEDHLLSLSITPAFIPSIVDERDSVGVWKLISCSHAYLEIFGAGRLPKGIEPRWKLTSTPLVEGLDGILTSISRDHNPFGLGEDRLYSTAGLEAAKIDRAFVGDIGGIGMPCTDAEPAQEIQSRWTGLKPEHLIRCAHAAMTDRVPGVVVVCTSAARQQTFIESIRAGMISHAVIDSTLATALHGFIAQAEAEQQHAGSTIVAPKVGSRDRQRSDVRQTK